MNLLEFKSQLENVYLASFPNSKISVKYSNGIYGSIIINCFLAQNINEVTSNIWENDIFSIKLSIDTEKGQLKNITDDEELPNNLKIESTLKSYRIKPTIQYMYCSSQKIAFRKTVGTPEKIITTFDKFIKNLKASLMNDFNNNNLLDKDYEFVKLKI